ncbi:MFS transporter [Pendulispora albinea]|uniref:MFS transporter n=1 Tax=Pendulispora albinea TaxID=2741071 RepID=A0ABZ2M6E2_9BACT
MHYAKTVFPLALIMFLIGADEYILASILAPIGETFQVEPARITLLVTAYALPCAIFAPLFGTLSDHWGRRRVLLPSLFIFALGTYGGALASSFTFALICRFIAGVAAAAMGPNAFALVGDFIPLERRPAAMGHVMLGLTIGLIVSPAIGGWVTQELGWRWAFGLLATSALATLAGAAIGIPSTRQASTSHASPGVATYARALTLPGVPAGIAAQGLWIGVTIGVMAIVGEVLRTRYTLSIVHTGLALASFGVLTIVGNLAVARAVIWTGSTRRAVLVANAATVIGIGGLTLLPSWPLAFALASFWLWAVFAGFGGPLLQLRLSEFAGDCRATVLSTSACAMHLGVVAMTFIEAWIFPQFGGVGVGVVACSLMSLAFVLQWRSTAG